MTNIQITCKFGQYSVTAEDSNGVRVAVEPGSCTFATRDEAQEYVDSWLDSTDGLVQIADGGRDTPSMRTIIRRRADGYCWTGDEWVNPNQTSGVLDAATYESYEAAQGMLDRCLESDSADDFDTAEIVTVER